MTFKLKSIASAIVLVFFLLIAGGSLSGEDIGFYLVLLLLGAIAVFLHIVLNDKQEQKKQLKQQKKIEELIILKERKQQRLIEEFGNYSKIISYNFDSFIIINEAESLILLNTNKYHFNKIIDFKVSDNETIIYSPTISKTTRNTGSMIGRAVVGGVLTGGIGAIVGGATAKKQTVTEESSSTIEHNYKVIVTVNNISHSNEILHIGASESEMNEISSLLQVIINRNEQLNA